MEHGDNKHVVNVFAGATDVVEPQEFLDTLLFFCELVTANQEHIAYMRNAAKQHKFARTDFANVRNELVGGR